MAQVKKKYQQLKDRYGPRYTQVMLGAAFVALFLPMPGSTLIAIALVVVIAEVHRGIAKSLFKPGLATTAHHTSPTNPRATVVPAAVPPPL